MSSRNGMNINILGEFCELCRYMKNGARLVTVDQLTQFEQNTWSKINDTLGTVTTDNETDCWMKEEQISVHGAVSWNRGNEKDHKYWLYTKIKEEWRCNACTMINPLLTKDHQDRRVANKECQFRDGHWGKSQEKRKSKRIKREK